MFTVKQSNNKGRFSKKLLLMCLNISRFICLLTRHECPAPRHSSGFRIRHYNKQKRLLCLAIWERMKNSRVLFRISLFIVLFYSTPIPLSYFWLLLASSSPSPETFFFPGALKQWRKYKSYLSLAKITFLG